MKAYKMYYNQKDGNYHVEKEYKQQSHFCSNCKKKNDIQSDEQLYDIQSDEQHDDSKPYESDFFDNQ